MADTYNLATDIGKVRLYANDNNIADPAFSDAELQVFIDNSPSNNLRLAAAWALRTLAFDTARMGKWAEARVNADAAANMAERLAKWLEKQAQDVDGISPSSSGYYLVAPWAGGISISEKDTANDDDDRVKPAFSINKMTNPDIGEEQDVDWL